MPLVTVVISSLKPVVSNMKKISNVRVIRLRHSWRCKSVGGREELVYLHALASERDWPLFPSCLIKIYHTLRFYTNILVLTNFFFFFSN